MDFSLSQEQQAARDVATSIFTPRSAARLEGSPPGEGSDWFDREAWKLLADVNMLGLALAEDVGGSGYGILETCVVLEEQGRHLIRIPGAPTLMVAAPAIDRFGSDEQRQRLLPGVVSGTFIVTAALAEPRSYNPRSIQTTAAEEPDGWRLTGEKHCVPFAQMSDVVLVPARTPDDNVAVFVVRLDAAGVTVTPQQTTNGAPESSLSLEGVAVAPTDVLGSLSHGTSILQWMIDRATLAACALQLGVADQALRMTARYTSEREQFGRPIGSFQAVAVRAAQAYFDVETIRVSVWQAAWRLAEGLDAEAALHVAKFWAAEGGQRVASTAQHLHGGLGVDVDYPLHRYTLWSKHNELTLGSATEHLARLGALLASSAAASGKAASLN